MNKISGQIIRAFSPAIGKYKISENVTLSSGYQLNDCEIAYETYGNLNKEKNNAILVCHAISGDSHVAKHDEEDIDGWWDIFVGPGKYIDTNKFVNWLNTKAYN